MFPPGDWRTRPAPPSSEVPPIPIPESLTSSGPGAGSGSSCARGGRDSGGSSVHRPGAWQGGTGRGRSKGGAGLSGQQDGSFWRRAPVRPRGGGSGGQWAAGTRVGGAARSVPGARDPQRSLQTGLRGRAGPGRPPPGRVSRCPSLGEARRRCGAGVLQALALANPCCCWVPVRTWGETSCGREIIAEISGSCRRLRIKQKEL